MLLWMNLMMSNKSIINVSVEKNATNEYRLGQQFVRIAQIFTVEKN